MNPFKYDVSFRIRHPTIDPEEISSVLGFKPTIHWMAGSQRRDGQGAPLPGEYDCTYWSCALTHEEGVAMADFLETFTNTLESHKEFLAHVCSTGGQIEYFVGWFSGFNSGEVFGHALLAKLADLQIDLSLDVYGASPS